MHHSSVGGQRTSNSPAEVVEVERRSTWLFASLFGLSLIAGCASGTAVRTAPETYEHGKKCVANNDCPDAAATNTCVANSAVDCNDNHSKTVDSCVEPRGNCSRVDRGTPLRILFVGNSYTHGGSDATSQAGLVNWLAKDADRPTPRALTSAISSANLDNHVVSDQTQAALRMQDKPSSGVNYSGTPWDVVVFQGHSTEACKCCGGDVGAFESALATLVNTALTHSPNARIVLFETPAYKDPGGWVYTASCKDRHEMQAHIRTGYNNAATVYVPANANIKLPHPGIEVARAGDAYEVHFDSGKAPTVLHQDDNSHQTDAGKYLNALMLFRKIYAAKTSGLGVPPGLSVSAVDAATLQAVADGI